MIISFFGDSLVNGVNDPDYIGWVGRLCAEARTRGCSMTVYNLGIRRNTSADLLARWKDELARREAPGDSMYLVFACGVADMVLEDGSPRISIEQSVANVRKLVEDAKAQHPVLFVGPPPVADPDFTSRVMKLDAAYAAMFREIQVPYLSILADLYDSELYGNDLTQGDGVHPSRAGYSHIFRLVDSWDAWNDWICPPEQE